MSLEALMKKSVDQGLSELERTRDTVIFGIKSGFNFAVAENPAAKQLERAMDENIGHSGGSYGYALKEVCARAKSELNAKVEFQDDNGEVYPVDPRTNTIHTKVTKLLLKL